MIRTKGPGLNKGARKRGQSSKTAPEGVREVYFKKEAHDLAGAPIFLAGQIVVRARPKTKKIAPPVLPGESALKARKKRKKEKPVRKMSLARK